MDSDFFAWTGLNIEGAIVIHNLKSKEQALFFDEPDEQKRLWESVAWDVSRIRECGFL